MVVGSGGGGGSAGTGRRDRAGKNVTRPIIADPATFIAADLTTLAQAAVLVHIGRCGLQGTTRPAVVEALRMPWCTVGGVFNYLEARRMITRYTQANGRGKCVLFVITGFGWALLTKMPDVAMFPLATTEVIP